MADAERLLRTGARAVRLPVLVLALAALVAAAAMLLLPHAIGRALDHALVGGPADGPFGRTWTQVAVALLLGLAAVESAMAFSAGAATAGATARIRHLLVGHASAAGPRLTRVIPAGDLVSRTTANAEQSGAAAANVLGAFAAGIPAVGAMGMLFRIDVWCGTAFLVGLLVLSILLATIVRTVTDISEQYSAAQGEVAGRLTEALTGARTVAAAGTVASERSRVLEPLEDLRRHGASLWTAQAGVVGQSAALLPLLEVIVLGVAGWRLGAGRVSVGDVVAAGAYVGLGIGVINALASLLAFAQSRGAARRCVAALEVPATGYGPVDAVRGPGALTLVDVWVGSGEEAALRGITLHIPAGASVAVVGRSGSGKSTLAALFGRLVEPDSGVVCIDGQLIRELSPAALHTAVTYAFPRPALLGDTIGGTIAFGHHRPGLDVVTAAARLACAEEFISRLPQGYATPLPQAPLSGGEAQRLGLARAFAHPGRVLVLDDATSSLDTVTERQVTTALHAGGGNQTRVIVAHRASTAARADFVIWLENGRVRGYAGHQQLWTRPDYRAVFGTGAVDPFAIEDLLPAPNPIAAPGTRTIPDPLGQRWPA
ncbi:MAG TPA: ABC transporter ATP-binding protein [Sporichthya sp.]|nr:ABC transporter ATP-binding protein [Sporichthya sp.]